METGLDLRYDIGVPFRPSDFFVSLYKIKSTRKIFTYSLEVDPRLLVLYEEDNEILEIMERMINHCVYKSHKYLGYCHFRVLDPHSMFPEFSSSDESIFHYHPGIDILDGINSFIRDSEAIRSDAMDNGFLRAEGQRTNIVPIIIKMEDLRDVRISEALDKLMEIGPFSRVYPLIMVKITEKENLEDLSISQRVDMASSVLILGERGIWEHAINVFNKNLEYRPPIISGYQVVRGIQIHKKFKTIYPLYGLKYQPTLWRQEMKEIFENNYKLASDFLDSL